MSVGYPRRGCEAEIQLEVRSDSDDVCRWHYAEPITDRCEDGHLITACEWDGLLDSSKMRELVLDYVHTGGSLT